MILIKAHTCTAGQKPGYYTDLLVAAGFLTPQLEKHPETSAHALGLQINRCLMATKSWHGILNIGRDLSHVFDSVNVSSAIHRIAKLIKYSRVGCCTANTLLLPICQMSLPVDSPDPVFACIALICAGVALTAASL